MNTAPAIPAAAIASMTGFARAEGTTGATSWMVEVKSVNGKALDIRSRIPNGFDAVDAAARLEFAKAVKRGNINLNINLSRAVTAGQLRLNRPLLAELVAIAREIEDAGAERPRIDALLAVRGILETGEEEETPEQRAALEADLIGGVRDAVARLAQSRLAEGARLAEVLSGHLDEITTLTDAAGTTASLQPAALKEKLRAQVQALLDAVPALPEERLAQEAALLIAKADVREELDRLRAHIAQARDMLAEGGAIGRRLDFLCQEFNREANTLCSKSADVELTRIGLSLKATIEQFREQVQNIE